MTKRRRLLWKLKILWHCYISLTRCLACGKFFRTTDFWNPYGPHRGPGLTCSHDCCAYIMLREGIKYIPYD